MTQVKERINKAKKLLDDVIDELAGQYGKGNPGLDIGVELLEIAAEKAEEALEKL